MEKIFTSSIMQQIYSDLDEMLSGMILDGREVVYQQDDFGVTILTSILKIKDESKYLVIVNGVELTDNTVGNLFDIYLMNHRKGVYSSLFEIYYKGYKLMSYIDLTNFDLIRGLEEDIAQFKSNHSINNIESSLTTLDAHYKYRINKLNIDPKSPVEYTGLKDTINLDLEDWTVPLNEQSYLMISFYKLTNIDELLV